MVRCAKILVCVALAAQAGAEGASIAVAGTCKHGDVVECPADSTQCAGDECCPDGSTCPSAHEAYSASCPTGKITDCLSASPSPGPSLAGTCSVREGDCLANDIGSVAGESAEDCCTACRNHPQCGAAVFVQGGTYNNTCFLKSECNPNGGCAGDSCTAVTTGVEPSPTPSPSPQPPPSPPSGKNWYDGIDSIKVLSPNDSFDWAGLYSSTREAQFSDVRHAILLTSGHYDNAQIGVGYYTSIVGVGATRHDVIVESFYSLDLNADGSGGGATQNFWRSVEGVTATNPSLTWATSQACPIRRTVVQGELVLSETGSGTHWSSGGFISDTEVQGSLNCGTQQQFFFRNSHFEGGVDCSGLTNGAFVGTVGEGDQPSSSSRIGATPEVAEKPFLVESNGQWHIAVPNVKSSSSSVGDDSDVTQISLDEVFVAQANHSAAEINSGIQGKQGLLLSPGIYSLDQSIVISQSGFVVLGLGFPTLVSTGGHSAITVDESASHVRVALVLFEAGGTISQETQAMLLWKGSSGIGSDIFSRVGSFKYRGCAVTRADIHVQIVGSNTILDNSWMWHADHDDCDTKSDLCYDHHGLQVDGESVTAYGLKVEHVLHGSLVRWNGEDGSVFFYQSELPYHAPTFGSSGFAGYEVNEAVTRHRGVALGVYIIFDEMTNVTAFRIPRGLDMQNLLAWCITGAASQFAHIVCEGSTCYPGDCSYNQCRLGSLPSLMMA